MLRFGEVKNVDESRAMVRVEFLDADGILSYWLPVLQSRTLNDKSYILPDENEHVVCLMDENSEEGVVLGSIYSEADLVPVSSKKKFHIKFEDGTFIEYDKQVHKLTADVKGSVEISADTEIDLAAPTVNINALNISMIGNVAVTGSISASVGVSAGSISLKTHTHFAPHEAGNTGAAQ